jgi:DDE superfamily endonuclease
VKNVLLVDAALTLLFLHETYVGSTHEKRIVEATPYPLPAGSRLLQDLGFLAFTLDQVEIIMPTRKPRGRKLTRTQKATNRRITNWRVRIEHVNSSVKRLRSAMQLEPKSAATIPHSLWERMRDSDLVRAAARGTPEEARWREDDQSAVSAK